MALVSARNRLIYFRVSEEELTRIRSLAASRGARSLSDLAREAIEGMYRQPGLEPDAVHSLIQQMDCLQNTLDRVSTNLEELNKHFAASGDHSPPAARSDFSTPANFKAQGKVGLAIQSTGTQGSSKELSRNEPEEEEGHASTEA
jgi:hypothetical protein